VSLPHRSPLLVIRVSSRGHFSVTKLLPKLLQLVLWIMLSFRHNPTRKEKPEMRTAFILFVVSMALFVTHYLLPFQNGADDLAVMFAGASLAIWAFKGEY
jgi:hypothetical protein